MQKFNISSETFFIFILFSSVLSLHGERLLAMPGVHHASSVIKQDYQHFYSLNTAKTLIPVLSLAAILAHTAPDSDIRDFIQNEWRSSSSDNFARTVKPFGDGKIMLPVYAGSYLLIHFLPNSGLKTSVQDWSTISLRSILVGAPVTLALQRMLGASRPTENDAHWRPFKDDNAVSGHAYMGAVPFLSAAYITQSKALKTIFYTSSTFTAWSRLNDDKHYFSQAILGWTLAWLSTRAASHNANIPRIMFDYNTGSPSVALRFTF